MESSPHLFRDLYHRFRPCIERLVFRLSHSGGKGQTPWEGEVWELRQKADTMALVWGESKWRQACSPAWVKVLQLGVQERCGDESASV